MIELTDVRILNERTETRKGGPVTKITLELPRRAGLDLAELVGQVANVTITSTAVQASFEDEPEREDDDIPILNFQTAAELVAAEDQALARLEPGDMGEPELSPEDAGDDDFAFDEELVVDHE